MHQSLETPAPMEPGIAGSTAGLNCCTLSCVIRKPAFCICENKDADQLRGNCEADQHLCFRYIESTIPLLPIIRNFKPLAILFGCTAQFVSDLVGNPEDRFSHNVAPFTSVMCKGAMEQRGFNDSMPKLAVKVLHLHVLPGFERSFWQSWLPGLCKKKSQYLHYKEGPRGYK